MVRLPAQARIASLPSHSIVAALFPCSSVDTRPVSQQLVPSLVGVDAASPAASATHFSAARALHSSSADQLSSKPTPPLPSTAAVSGGSLSHVSASLGQLLPSVMNRLAACERERANLRAEAPFLMVKPSEWSELKVAEFQAAGAKIKVLKRDPKTQRVTLAMAKIPAITFTVFAGPKGFSDSMDRASTMLVFDEQRIRLIEELLVSTQSHSPKKYGVLFSGPNGVGKSAICLEAALFCFAMGVPSVYIPMAAKWVDNSKTKDESQAYVMTQMFLQNADLIVRPDYSDLEPYFREQLRGEPAQPRSYLSLTNALKDGSVRPAVFIADEVQGLNQASTEFPFWKLDFMRWTGSASEFRWMSCASAHGLREFKLPGGEFRRLRFVNPMRPEDADILLQEPDSPFFHAGYSGAGRASLRAQVLKLTGSMPRDLSRFAQYLVDEANSCVDPSKTSIDEIRENIAVVAHEVTTEKQDDALKQWINQSNSVAHHVYASEKLAALLSVFRDTARFSPDVKDLYDYGLVKRVDSGMVAPCSLMASEALSYVFAHLRVENEDMPLSQLTGGERGIELEKRIFRAIMLQNIRPKDFAVHHARSPITVSQVLLGASVIQTSRYADLRDIEALPGKRSLWIPSKSKSRFDGIVMPALEQLDTEPMVVFDPSVTEPYELRRREKAKTLFELCGVLKRRFPSACSPVPLVIWDGDFSSLERVAGEDPVEDMPEAVMIMDRGGLRAMGLVL